MTDEAHEGNRESAKTLDSVASAAGHELRNALNGLLVNLEVVRSMALRADFDAEPFMSQALSQSEESARLAEAAIALMKLLSEAIQGASMVSRMSSGTREVVVETGPATSRLSDALMPLAARGVLSVETSGSTVILRIPEESPH